MADDPRDLARAEGFNDQQIAEYEARIKSRAQEIEPTYRQPDRYGRDPGTAPWPMNAPEEQARGELAGVEGQEGAPLGVRTVRSLMKGLWTPESQLHYYRKKFGPENVQVTPGGDITWREPGGPWRPMVGKDLELGDIGDFLGMVPEMVGAGIFPWLRPARPVVNAAIGSMLGAGVKQVAGALSSGEPIDPVSAAEDYAGAGLAGAVGGATGKVLPPATLRPDRAAARWLVKAEEGDNAAFANMMRDLQTRHGIPLSQSQESGTPFAQMVEGFTGRTGPGRLAAARLEPQQDQATLARAMRLFEQLAVSPNAMESETFGRALANTGQRAVDSQLSAMQRVGNEYFNFRSQVLGKEKRIPGSNWKEVLRTEAERYKELGDQASLGKARVMEGILNDPATAMGLSPLQVQEFLSRYNAASYGKEAEKLFPALDQASGMRVAKALHEALTKDLAEEAAGKGLGKQQALALQTGLARYSEEAKKLGLLRDTPILQILDNKGLLKGAARGETLVGADAAADALKEGIRGGKFSPSELRNMSHLLRETNPELGQRVVGSLIFDAIEAGMQAGRATPQGFSRKAFLDALPQDKHVSALIPGVRGEEAAQTLREIGTVLERSFIKPGFGIPESPLTQAVQVIKHMVTNPTSAVALALSKFYTPYELSKLMTDPAARIALRRALNAHGEGPAVTGRSFGRQMMGRLGVSPATEGLLRAGQEDVKQPATE